MQQLYDITRTVSPSLAPWPGDEPFASRQVASLEEGQLVNLTKVTFSPHLGTHIDANWHIKPEEVHPADLPLEVYIGPARVVTIARQEGGMTPEDFAGGDLTGVERLLIHTCYSEVPDHRFDTTYPYPTVSLIDWLADQGVRLLGLDVPSVDAFDSQTLAAHHRLFERGMLNIELLQLDGVPDGDYELVALPLKLAGICGSPVRAILRPLA